MTVELAHPSTEPLGSRSPTEPAHPRWWFVATTPGRILSIGLVLAILGGLTAFATSTTINQRQHALTTVLSHTEPLAFAAGRLYTTLSVADAAAATAFIAQAEPRTVRQRYEQAITDAAVAVTRASSGLTDEPMVQLLGRVNAELAVYTGLIEIARTNNRAGNPVGSSYLSEASTLMQSTILPDAARLYAETSERVDTETTASTEDSGAGDSGGAHHRDVRRVLAPVAGPPNQAAGESRSCRRCAGGARHGGVGRHGARDLHQRTAAAPKHGGRVTEDRHHHGDHRAAGTGRRDAVPDPARGRRGPQAVLLPAHRRHAETARPTTWLARTRSTRPTCPTPTSC